MTSPILQPCYQLPGCWCLDLAAGIPSWVITDPHQNTQRVMETSRGEEENVEKHWGGGTEDGNMDSGFLE